MDCIKWLDSNNIKWFPLLLNEKKEQIEKVIESLYNTKIYWFIKRCLDSNINKRELLLI